MIDYNFLIKWELPEPEAVTAWISFVIEEEGCELGEVNYIFVDDEYLLDINIKALKHNTLTDIISFDYSLGHVVSGDIYISIERIRENAQLNSQTFIDELHRVMVHGILHYIGYQDKTEDERNEMRSKEDYYLSLRTF